MSSSAKPVARIQYHRGALGQALDAIAQEQLEISEGTEIEVRVEEGRLIIEPVRSKIVVPASDIGAREERRQRIAESMRHVMDKHDDAFALLAK